MNGQTDEQQGTYPIEYWYIDFDQLILGEKTKHLTGDDHKTQEELKFTDEYYANLIWIRNEDDDFFMQDTVQKLIDYQFARVQAYYKFKFFMFLFSFIIPFSYLVIMSSKYTCGDGQECLFFDKNLLYYLCALTQILTVILECFRFWM